MSTELLHYCLDQLLAHPRVLRVRVPLDNTARKAFSRAWAHARFETQQQSILLLSPDDPLFGRGYLWPYALQWTEADIPPGNLLRIEYNLNLVPAPRELILLASVIESPISVSFSRTTFNATKNRMLGRETKRVASAVAPSLRPGVAAVQYACQGGPATIAAVQFPDVVDIEP